MFVTNGYMTRQALETIQPYLTAANIDLKSFSDASYKKNCKALLQPVLDTIAAMKSLGVWVEVTTLVIPGENDSDNELKQIAEFLAGMYCRFHHINLSETMNIPIIKQPRWKHCTEPKR